MLFRSQRTERELERADLVIEVVDASSAGNPSRNQRSVSPELSRRHVLVLNKSDLGIDPAWSCAKAIPVSCLTGSGIEELRSAIRDVIATAGPLASDHPVAINARHKAAFERTVERLHAAKAALERNEAPEFIALEVREALQSLGDVIGQVDVEQILDVIFSTFCIGK